MEHSFLVLRRKALAILVGTIAASVVALAPHTEVRAVAPPKSYGIVKVIPVGNDPSAIAINPAGTRAYVTNATSNNVSVIDTTTGTVTGTINVGNDPSDIAINPAGTRAYVTNAMSNNVSVIDTTTGTVLTTIMVGNNPSAIAITPNGAFAYVTNATSNNVSVIDTTTGTVTGTINVGNDPSDIAITPNGTRAYVTNRVPRTVSIIDVDPSSGTFNTVLATSTAELTNLLGITISGDGSRAVTFQANRIVQFDLNSNTHELSLGIAGAAIRGMASAGTNSFYWINSLKQFGTFDYTSRSISFMGEVGANPSALAVAPSGQFPIYIASSGAPGTVTVIDELTPTISPQTGAAGTAVTVTVTPSNIAYDIDDNAVTDVKFGGVAATAITPGAGNTWIATAPAGSGAAALVVTFGWLQQPGYLALGYRQASAGTFTYPASSPAVPIRQVSLDPGGGTCLDVTTRTEPWLSVFVGYRYIPGARDCTRSGYSFVGWAERTTPTTNADLALLDDPTDNVPRYFISRDADLVAVWTLVPKAPSVFVGISNWLCRNCGVLLFWNAPTTQTGPTITTGSGVAVCTKPDNLLSLGDWTMCHERTGAPGIYNLSQGTTKLFTTIR